MTLLSRIAGYVRDLVQAQIFGASSATDAFLVAYRIPNFLRRIFAEGSFTTAFVPVFTEYKQKGDEAALKDLLNNVAGVLLGAVLLVTAIAMFASPLIASLFAPSSAMNNPLKHALISDMLLITFPYLVFISMTALAAGVLNSFGKFALPAVTPVLHNFAVIAAALFLAPILQVPIKALAWGVFGAGFIQMVVQFIAIKRMGLMPRPRFNTQHEGVRRIMKLMLPTIFSSSVAQINLIVGTIFADLLMTGSQTWLYYTDRLLEFPLGMFGVAIGTVILPTLSKYHADTDAKNYSKTLDWGLRLGLTISLPATLGLILMAEPLNAALYQHGNFGLFDTKMAALSLMTMSIGLPGFVLAKVLSPAFFSKQDTKTPVRAALWTVFANVFLCCLFVFPMWYFKIEGAHAGIALATGLAGLVNAFLLWRYLKRSKHLELQNGWGVFLFKLLIACTSMTVFVLAARYVVGDFAAMKTLSRLVHLSWIVGGAAILYGGVLYAMGLRIRHLGGGS